MLTRGEGKEERATKTSEAGVSPLDEGIQFGAFVLGEKSGLKQDMRHKMKQGVARTEFYSLFTIIELEVIQ